MRTKNLLFYLVALAFLISCGKEQETPDRVVIGISADVQTFNPVFAFSVDEGSISELLFLNLVDFRWDSINGDLSAKPMLAKKWEWADDSSSVTFYLRDDVTWSDGEKLTAEDVVFSLDVYSDPTVQSRVYGMFDDLYTDNENHIDTAKTFVVISPYVLQINFKTNTTPNLVDVCYPVIPKHIFSKLNKKDLATAEENFNPVTSGPFKLKKWKRNQSIILKANKNSFLYDKHNVQEMIFKIIPDYTSRLTQLKKGEIDLMELIHTEDIEEIGDKVNIKTIDGREYDYVAWNNVDPDIYSRLKKIEPNSLFGSRKVRIALTHAINRKEILGEYLYNYGEIAVAPVSSIFKKYFDKNIKPYDYDPEKARAILKKEGWFDSNNNGTIDRNGKEFSFTLTYPGGNPLRQYAATIIKNNLKAVGIDVTTQTLELGAFIDNLNNKSMEAWMAAWYIPVPLEIKPYWYSVLKETPLNFVSYQSEQADKIMDKLERNLPLQQKQKLYYEFQKIIHNDEPVTFMYWISDIVGISKKLRNIEITPLGVIAHCWEWSVKN